MPRRAVAAAAAFLISTGPAMLAAPAWAGPGTPGPLTTTAGDVIPGLAALRPLGPTAPGTPVEIDVVLQDASPAAEAQLVRDLYANGSPDYHHFLTPAAYAARFAVPAARFDAARSYATAHGLTVLRTSRSRDLITLTGTVGEAERTFRVGIDDFAWHGRHFYANVNAPAVPAGLGIVGVVGLNSAQRMRTFHNAPPAGAPHGRPAQDTCDPTGSLVCVGVTTPEDLRSAYDVPSDNQGQGQSLAIFGEGYWTGPINDLRLFEKHFGLPAVPVKVIATDGNDLSKYSDASGDIEWDLDSQATTGMAPDIQQLDLYFGTSLSDASVGNMFSVWADDPNGPAQANASFGECEYDPLSSSLPSGDNFAAGESFTQETEQALTQAVAEGRTLFASAGDTGSSCPIAPVNVNGVGNELFPDVNYPCASPHAVCVGGTVLYTTGGDTETSPGPSKATRVDEYSWNYTGGGSSFIFPEPQWQAGTAGVGGQVPSCLYDSTGTPVSGDVPCRAVPDVAAQSGDIATNGYSIYIAGALSEEGGTSLSSPLNVGLWTLDQAASAATGPAYSGLGFADPSFYAHPADFYDIGNPNSAPPSQPNSNGYFVSAPGWDYLSGLGVVDSTALMKALDNGNTLPVQDTPSPNQASWVVVNPAGTVLDSSATVVDPACVPLFTAPPGGSSYPPGTGQDYPQLDVLKGDLHNTATTLTGVLTIENLQTGPTAAPAPGDSIWYFLSWDYTPKGGTDTEYYLSASIDPSGVYYAYGTVGKTASTTTFNPVGSATGSVVPGTDGTITISVPLSDVGSPASGDVLVAPAAQVDVWDTVPQAVPVVGGNGGGYQADTAGPQYNYTLGEICAATGAPGSDGGAAGPAGGTVPEAPLAALLPIVGVAAAGLALWRRRRARG